jgi:hypothetical protein
VSVSHILKLYIGDLFFRALSAHLRKQAANAVEHALDWGELAGGEALSVGGLKKILAEAKHACQQAEMKVAEVKGWLKVSAKF